MVAMTTPETSSTVTRFEQIDDGIFQLTLDRPDALNALDLALIADLERRFAAFGRMRGLRAVILTGAGRAFCAGLDLAAIDPSAAFESEVQPEDSHLDPAAAEPPGRAQLGMALQKRIAGLMLALREQPVPVIAAVNGAAVGGGLALALASDIRIGSQSARFGDAFVRIGISGCDVGVSWMLPRIVGAGRAHELMLTGRIIDAAEAQSIGLLTDVVAADQLVERAVEVARMIRRNSPFGVWMTKEVSYANQAISSMRAAIDLENRTQILASFTEDTGEAVGAFFEKREPRFSNR